jgi:hypothetical protein
MAQSIKGARAALYAACVTLYAGRVDSTGAAVLVTYGLPGSFQPQNIIGVGLDTRQPITRPTMGTARSRETFAEIDVAYSIFRAGDSSQQQAAAEDADDLVALLESYLRIAPNEKLGGASYDAWVSNIAGPALTASIHPKTGAVTGYIAESIAAVTIKIRY